MAVAVLTACAGFLLAVLWMDLIFDTQIRRSGGDEATLASIAGYYRRATTTSRPMSRLIAVVMAALLVTLAVEAFHGSRPGWMLAVSTVLTGGPVLLAAVRTLPNAVRLGGRDDPPARQAHLARAIYRDHLVCAAAILAFLVLWLVHAPG